MIPRTLSASSLQVWELCPDRWTAEYHHRAPQEGGTAAMVGTSVHGGLERFVEAVYINREYDGLTRPKLKDLLIMFYQMSYVETFNSADYETPEYKDGFNLSMAWFQRTDLSGRTVLSVENKETIFVPYNHPEGVGHRCDICAGVETLVAGQCQVPFNYIMDRLDQTGENEYEVVDYKTIRAPLQPSELQTKLQARAYALAVQIKYPNAAKIKVTFDLLRHEQVGMWFTRDDNIAFWRFLCATLQAIVNTDEGDVKPNINAECGYCVKKFTCPLVLSNIDNGGKHALSLDEKAIMVLKLKEQLKAQKLIVEALEEDLMLHAYKSEQTEWTTEDGNTSVEITAQRRREFQPAQAAQIMGPELFSQMGNMTLGNLEKIIGDESLDPAMRAQLKSLIGYTTGSVGVRIKSKKAPF
jgi:hypothetical protein